MLSYSLTNFGGCFDNSGYGPNYLEVGGPDTGVVSAVGNTLANVPGMIGPVIAVAVKNKTGSFLPYFGVTAALHVLAGLFFQACGTTESARDILARRDQRNQQNKNKKP